MSIANDTLVPKIQSASRATWESWAVGGEARLCARAVVGSTAKLLVVNADVRVYDVDDDVLARHASKSESIISNPFVVYTVESPETTIRSHVLCTSGNIVEKGIRLSLCCLCYDDAIALDRNTTCKAFVGRLVDAVLVKLDEALLSKVATKHVGIV